MFSHQQIKSQQLPSYFSTAPYSSKERNYSHKTEDSQPEIVQEKNIEDPSQATQKQNKQVKLQKRDKSADNQIVYKEEKFEGQQKQYYQQRSNASINQNDDRNFRQSRFQQNQDRFDYNSEVKNILLEDQLKITQNAKIIEEQASNLIDMDILAFQQQALVEMRQEKDKFIKYLDKQEFLLKNEANNRIFSLIDEIQDVKLKENQFIDGQIIKNNQIQQDNKSQKKQENFDMELKRKEILVKQAGLKPLHNLGKLSQLINTAPQFETLSEDKKREIYSSIKIGLGCELAKIELYKYENEEESTLNQIKLASIRAQHYQNLLKQVLPKEFNKEYLSLKEIKKKRAAAEKSFQVGINNFKNQIFRMQQIKKDVLKNKELLNQQVQQHDSQEFDPSNEESVNMIVPYFQFQKQVKVIDELKKQLDLIKTIEPTQILDQDREIEKANQSNQISFEQDTEQQKNLLLLLLNLNSELSTKIKVYQYKSAERSSVSKDDEGKVDQLLFTHNEIKHLDKEISFEFKQRELLKLLKQYKVDINWLRAQQTAPLQQIMDKKNEKLYERAVQIENNLLLNEKRELLGLINKQANSNDIKKYFLNKLKSQQFAEGMQGYQGGEDQLLDQVIIAQIENQLKNKNFNPTAFIISKLKRLESENLQFKRPTISTIDEAVIQEQEYKSAHAEDQKKPKEVMSYDKYKYRQIKKLHDKNLGVISENPQFQQMTNAKQYAWYNIYNDYLQNLKESEIQEEQIKPSQNLSLRHKEIQLPNKIKTDDLFLKEDFFEQFRNWEFKSFLDKGNFQEKEIKNIKKALKYMQASEAAKNKQENEDELEIEQPNIQAAFQEVYRIIGKNTIPFLSVRKDEAYTLDLNDPSNFQQIQQLIYHSELQQNDEFLHAFKEELMEQNQMASIYDKVEGDPDHQILLKSYEDALKELNQAKKDFLKKFGVNFHNFNPVQIIFEDESKQPYKEIATPDTQINDAYQPDLRVADEILKSAYLEQFPNDPKMEKYDQNLPKLKMSEENKEKIKKHIYNENIQKQYYNAIHNTQTVEPQQELMELFSDFVKPKSSSQDKNIQEAEIRTGKELDDQLIKRINFHLNDKYQRELKVVDSLQLNVLDNNEQYDVEAYEQYLAETPDSNISEYQKQQFLLYRLRLKQAKLNKGLQQMNQQVKNELKLEKQFNKEKLRGNIDTKSDNIEQIQATLKVVDDISRLEAINSQQATTDNQQPQLQVGSENTKLQNDKQVSEQEQNELHNYIQNQINAIQNNELVQQDRNLMKIVVSINKYLKQYENTQNEIPQKYNSKEEIKNGKDPIQQSLKNLLIERSKLNRKLYNNNLLNNEVQDYLFVNNFEQQASEDLIDSKHKEYEDQKMQYMANNYQEFDLVSITNLQVPEVAYTGESQRSLDKLSNLVNAQSSSHVIEAAKSQSLSPEQQKQALLYDPLNPAREQFLRTKYQMYVNKRLRQDLAQKIIDAQDQINNAKLSQETYEKDAQNIINRFSGQILPKKAYDLIKEQNRNNESTQQKAQKLQINEILKSINTFDPLSKNISSFNDELRLQLAILRQENNKNNEADAQQQVQYILQLLKQNNVNPNTQTLSLLFQINVEVNELDKANQNLKSILVQEKNSFSSKVAQIDAQSLNKFYDASLREDNFEGLSHMIIYLEKNNIDISNWNLTGFRSAVDFYLNHAFNINNIFTFTRFYVHHANCCLSLNQNIQQHLPNLEQKSPEILALVHNEIFGQLEKIVDMNSLFQHLVNKLGNKTLLDPISQVDPMQNIIDFFSKKEIQAIQKCSELCSTFINEEDISQYYANNLTNPESFQRIFNQVLKFNNNQYFISSIIKVLRDHIALKDQLPSSFQNISKIKQLYLKIKTAVEENNQKLSEKSAEFLLFVFKMNKMTEESLDLTQNFHNLVQGYEDIEQIQKQSDIRNYYMSEALLNLDIDKHNQNFNTLVQNAVYNDQQETSEAFLSSMVKAYMLDGNVDYALEFFQKGFNQRKQNYFNQEEMLVNLFDSTFGNKGKKNLQISQSEFKNRYLSLVQAREQLKKEAKVVKQLQKILNNCDPEEIDNLFMLQAILREERLILLKLVDMSGRDYFYVQNQFEKCKEDQDLVNDFVSKLATKYSIVFKHPELLASIQEGIANQSINIDLLKQGQSKEIAQFSQIVKNSCLNQGAHQNQLLDSLSTNDWLQLIQEKDIITKAKKESKFIKKVQKELLGIKQRKSLLDLKIQNQNKEQLMKILKENSNQKIEILNGVTDIDVVLQKLGIDQNEQNQFKTYEKQKDEIEQVIEMMQLESQQGPQIIQERINQSIVKSFKDSMKESTEQTVKDLEKRKYEEDFGECLFKKFDKKFRFKKIKRLIRRGFFSKKGQVRTTHDKKILKYFKTDLYEIAPQPNKNPNELENEELILKSQIYNLNVQHFQDDLKLVLESRRANQLPFAIKTFNKIQKKEMPMWLDNGNEINSKQNQNSLQKADLFENKQTNLDFNNADNENVSTSGYSKLQTAANSSNNDNDRTKQYQLFNSKMQDPKLITQTIQRYEYLLNDVSSPVISNFLFLIDYRDGRDIIDYKDFYEMHKTGKRNNLLTKYLKQSEQLVTLNDELDKMIAVTNDMNGAIQNHHQQLIDEIESAQQFKTQFTQQREQSLQNLINQNINELYNQFTQELEVKIEGAPQQSNQMSDNSQIQEALYQKVYSREQKVQIMKQALSLDLGGFKSYEIFNSFFAEDFIVFGMHNNIPEAVRLGEYLLSESKQAISKDLQKALKNYKLNYSDQYREAMRRTGQMSISNIYNNVQRDEQSFDNKYSKSSIVSADDPYWREFVERNFRTQDRYKIPSAMAWDHKDDGIIGEVINLKDMHSKLQQFEKLL